MKQVLLILVLLIIGCILIANIGNSTSECTIKYEWTVGGEYVPVWHCHTIDNDGGS